MIKDEIELEASDYDFDDEFNLPFDTDVEPSESPGSERNPAKAIATEAYKSIQSTFTDPDKIETVIKDTLPKEYGEAIEFYTDSYKNISNIYNDAVDAIAPINKQLKSLTAKVLPNIENILPEKIVAKLKEYSTTEPEYTGFSTSKESQVNELLLEVFGNNVKAQEERYNREEAKDNLTESISHIRHSNQLEVLNSIYESVKRQADYQDNILINYQRKSLELQIRAYGIQSDQYGLQQKSFTDIINKLNDIVKNTGLPEYVKINKSEVVKESIRDRFVAEARDSFFGDTSKNFLNRFMTNFGKNTRNLIQQFVDGIKGSLDAVESSYDLSDSLSDLGMGEKEPPMYVKTLGGLLGDETRNFVTSKVRGILEKNEKINSFGKEFLARTTALQDDFRRSVNGDSDGIISGVVGNALSTLAGTSSSGVAKIDIATTDSLKKAKPFDNLDSKAIREVIPGYLSRILQAIQSWKENRNVDEIQYDYSTNSFKDKSVIKKETISNLFAASRKYTQDQASDVLDLIDKDKTVTEEEKQEVLSRIIRHMDRKGYTDIKYVGNSRMWGNDELAEKIATLFKSYVQVDATGKRIVDSDNIDRQRKLTRELNRVLSNLGRPFEEVQKRVDLGQLENIRELNLLKGNNLNKAEVMRYLTMSDADFERDFGTKKLKSLKEIKEEEERKKEAMRGSLGKVRASVEDKIKKVFGKPDDEDDDDDGTSAPPTPVDPKPKGPGPLGPIAGFMVNPLANTDIADIAKSTIDKAKSALDTLPTIDSSIIDKAVASLAETKKNPKSIVNYGTKLPTGIQTTNFKLDANTLGQYSYKAINYATTISTNLLPFDVYIKTDLKEPVLYSTGFKDGNYYSRKTGKLINHPKQIDGEVVDKNGNILLSLEHIKTGLVDKNNNNIQTNIADTTKLNKIDLDKGLDFVRNLGTGSSNALSTMVNGLKDYFNDALPMDKVVEGNDKITEVLEKVHSTLDKRLPEEKKSIAGDLDGDGLRDGSYEQKKKNSKENTLTDLFGKLHKSLNLLNTNTLNNNTSMLEMFKKLKEGGGLLSSLFSGIRTIGGALAIGNLLKGGGLLGGALGGAAGLLGKIPGVGKIVSKIPGLGRLANAADNATGKGKSGLLSSLAGGVVGNVTGGLLSKIPVIGPIAGIAGDMLGDAVTNIAGGAFNSDGFAGGGDNNNDKRANKDTKSKSGKRGKAPKVDKVAQALGKVSSATNAVTGAMNDKAAQLASRMAATNTPLGKLGGKALTTSTSILGKGANIAAKVPGFLHRTAIPNSTLLNIGSKIVNPLAHVARFGLTAATGLGKAGLLAAKVGAGLLSWPVVVGGSLAIGGYMAYKWYKKTKLDDVSKVRLAQYGFRPEDGIHEKIFALEDEVVPNITIDDSGKISLNHENIDLDKIKSLFSVSSKRDLEIFNKWYHERFRPVLAANLIALKNINKAKKKDYTLPKAINMEPEDKLELVNKATANMSTVHDLMVSPISSIPPTVNEAGVQSEVELFKAKVDAELKKKGKEALSGGSAIKDTVKSVGGPDTPEAMLDRYRNNQNLYKVVDKDGKEIQGDELTKQEAIKSGKATIQAAIVVPDTLVYKGGNTIDALKAVRFKTYGLKDMEKDKVRALTILEQVLDNHVVNIKGTTKINIPNDQVITLAGKNFGVTDLNGEMGKRFKYWFNTRFLPVYLMYHGAAFKITGKPRLYDNEGLIKPDDQLVIARNIISVTTINKLGSKVSVWTITDSPWRDYELETNPDVTLNNIEAIKALIKKITMGEISRNAPNEKDRLDSKLSDKIADSPLPKAMTTVPAALVATMEAPQAPQAFGESIVDNNQSLKTTGDKVTISTGTGGKVEDVPPSKGDGWQANKDTIITAAKMSGVDPKLLANMIGIESSFRPSVVNPTTKATGLGQFLPSSWKYITEKYGKKYGITPRTSALDPRANSLMTAEYIKENANIIRKNLGREVTQLDSYLAHFLGGGGASNFLKANPNDLASEVAPAAAKSNKSIFFKNPGAMSGPNTVKEVLNLFDKKMKSVVNKFNIDPKDFESVTTADLQKPGTIGGNPSTPPLSSVSNTNVSNTSTPAPLAANNQPNKVNTSTSTTSTVGTTSSAISTTGTHVPSTNTSTPVIQDVSGPTPAPSLSHTANTSPTPTVLNPGIKATTRKDGVLRCVLQREDSGKHGTFGTLSMPDGTVFHTMELAWKENKPRESCIPAGEYTCKRRQTTKHGFAYEVLKVPGRSAILIHKGSFGGDVNSGMRADSAGCILLGLSRDEKASQPRIHGTIPAMQKFDQITGNATLQLVILPSKGQMTVSVQNAINQATLERDDVKGVTGTVSTRVLRNSNSITQDTMPNTGYGGTTTQPSVAPALPIAPAYNPPIVRNELEQSTTKPSTSGSKDLRNIANNSTTVNTATIDVNPTKATTNIQNRQTVNRAYNPTPQEQKVISQQNQFGPVIQGIDKTNELLSKLVGGQTEANKLLSEIAKKKFEVSQVETKEDKSKGIKSDTKDSTTNPGSARTNTNRPSRPLPESSIKMDRIV